MTNFTLKTTTNYLPTVNKIEWPYEMYVRPKSFIVTMMLSSSPFLATILLLFFVQAVLSRLFTLVRERKRLRHARDQMKMQNFIELVTYGRKDFVDNENTFEEIVGRGEQARIFHERRERRAKLPAWLNGKKSIKPLTDFQLPDEDRCPIDLVNDAIAKTNKKSIAERVAESCNAVN